MTGQANISVLLADDHAGVRGTIRRLLERAPLLHVAGEAADGDATVCLARELEPDVVLMDVSMPGLSGIEATRLIVAATRSRVLMLSLQADGHVVRESLRAGAAGYVLKEHAGQELLRAIDCVMAGGRYLGGGCAHAADDSPSPDRREVPVIPVEAPMEERSDGECLHSAGLAGDASNATGAVRRGRPSPGSHEAA